MTPWGSTLPGSHANAGERMMFTVQQDVPALAAVDIGIDGPSHADMLAFEAAIEAEDGAKGTLTGILITVDLPVEADDIHEDRLGQLVFDLGSGSSLVVAGESVYAREATEMDADRPQIRAVVGGTGRFLGARGQVTTTRNA
ncbi:MAG: dirigent protein, partial [Hyphomicrobiales bacterium]|nr:dirigent protein [Hyphomicrobiales bacterium]